MIRVGLPVAPGNYRTDVLDPGTAFLRIVPRPKGDDWRGRNYWSAIHDYLHNELSGICAYCASFTPRRKSIGMVDNSSVDHYIPKSLFPHTQAYDWNNFRLARAALNHRKGDFRDVMDPCAVTNGWFRLNFTTFAIEPDASLSEPLRKKVADTVIRLQLNLDDDYVNERARAVYRYSDGKLSFGQLSRLYPFIASEMTARNFDSILLPTFRGHLSNPRLRAALIRQGWT